MRTLLVLLAVAFVTLAAAVGAVGSGAQTAAADQAQAARITVRSSDYGRIVFDGRGRALYAFTLDAAGPSRCFGACATAWPPFIVTSRPRAAAGVSASLIGTIRRPDGRLQATYDGWPLYYYVGDRRPGEVRCQNVVEFGGTWLVLRSNGRLVR